MRVAYGSRSWTPRERIRILKSDTDPDPQHCWRVRWFSTLSLSSETVYGSHYLKAKFLKSNISVLTQFVLFYSYNGDFFKTPWKKSENVTHIWVTRSSEESDLMTPASVLKAYCTVSRILRVVYSVVIDDIQVWLKKSSEGKSQNSAVQNLRIKDEKKKPSNRWYWCWPLAG